MGENSGPHLQATVGSLACPRLAFLLGLVYIVFKKILMLLYIYLQTTLNWGFCVFDFLQPCHTTCGILAQIPHPQLSGSPSCNHWIAREFPKPLQILNVNSELQHKLWKNRVCLFSLLFPNVPSSHVGMKQMFCKRSLKGKKLLLCFVSNHFFVLFWLCQRHVRSWFPHQGWKLHPQHEEETRKSFTRTKAVHEDNFLFQSLRASPRVLNTTVLKIHNACFYKCSMHNSFYISKENLKTLTGNLVYTIFYYLGFW